MVVNLSLELGLWGGNIFGEYSFCFLLLFDTLCKIKNEVWGRINLKCNIVLPL